MTEIEKMAIGAAMRKMYNSGWFSICTLNDCLAMAGIIPLPRPYRILQTLHCVHFVDMPKELRSAVPKLIEEAFNGVNINELVEATMPAGSILSNETRGLLR